MKIVNGIEMKVNMENNDDFAAYLAGQIAIKEATGFHSATFDEAKKKATMIYLNNNADQELVRGQKIVKVYVE